MHIQTRQIAATLLTVLTTAAFATACSSDSDSPVGPPSGGASYDSLTVDASASWAAVQLGDPSKHRHPLDEVGPGPPPIRVDGASECVLSLLVVHLGVCREYLSGERRNGVEGLHGDSCVR